MPDNGSCFCDVGLLNVAECISTLHVHVVNSQHICTVSLTSLVGRADICNVVVVLQVLFTKLRSSK
jgi:hypothetical protein